MVSPAAGGCVEHRVSLAAVEKRWEQTEAIIDATPEDDHEAQWSGIYFCGCCLGPAKDELCSRCAP